MSIGALQKTANTLRSTAKTHGSQSRNIVTGESERRCGSMTREETINNLKYKICCPLCDNDKCVRGTDSCEAEMWARDKAESEDKE